MSKKVLTGFAAMLLLGLTVACSQNQNTYRNVESDVRNSLDAAGLRDVKADQDRDKGVVTLSGEVRTEDEKARAEQIAQSVASGQVVANQIEVRPAGAEREAEKAQSSMDDAIENYFKAELVKTKMDSGIDFDAKEGVLTLKGEVDSAAKRQQLEKMAAAVPNVRQVVNEIQIKSQSASTRP